MFFNIILPFIIAYYKEGFDIVEFLKRLFNIHPPLTENSITRSFIKLLPNNISYSQLNSSIKTYFGIIFYHKEYVK